MTNLKAKSFCFYKAGGKLLACVMSDVIFYFVVIFSFSRYYLLSNYQSDAGLITKQNLYHESDEYKICFVHKINNNLICIFFTPVWGLSSHCLLMQGLKYYQIIRIKSILISSFITFKVITTDVVTMEVHCILLWGSLVRWWFLFKSIYVKADV